MAKTESTAVTRLIELSQQRALKGDFDWFAAPKPRRMPRERADVTQVVRIARRALVVSPGAVVGAFFAGVLTVAITTWFTRQPPPPVPRTVAIAAPETVAIAIPETVAIAIPETIAIPERAVTETVAVAVAVTETVAVAVTETVAVAVTETVAVDRDRDRDRPASLPRPARSRPPAFAPRARISRPPQRDAGPLAELRINSKPPCELYIDGRHIGWTPQRGVSVAPGRHTVVFRNREQGVERKVIVDTKVGQVHRIIRDFTEP